MLNYLFRFIVGSSILLLIWYIVEHDKPVVIVSGLLSLLALIISNCNDCDGNIDGQGKDNEAE